MSFNFKTTASRAVVFSLLYCRLTSPVIGQSCPKWVATVEEKNVSTTQTLKSPQFTFMRNALLTIDDMTHHNAAFSKIPNARLRNYLFAGIYYDAKSNEKLTGEINIDAYSQKGGTINAVSFHRQIVLQRMKALLVFH
jgi:hypothetical protein